VDRSTLTRGGGRSWGAAALAWAAVIAAATTLVACGGHGSSGQATVTVTTPGQTPQASTPTPAPRGNKAPLTEARARSFANAVNLTAADLPGFTAAPRTAEHESAAERASGLRFQRCIGGRPGALNGSGELSSPQFTRRGLVQATASSSVSFFASAAVGPQELKLLRSAHARSCLASFLDERFAGKRYGRVVIRRVSIAHGVPPAVGTTGGFAWRIRAEVQVRGVVVPFYLDILGFIYGPAEVRLLSSSLVVPFPAAGEEQLYRLLVARATTHGL